MHFKCAACRQQQLRHHKLRTWLVEQGKIRVVFVRYALRIKFRVFPNLKLSHLWFWRHLTSTLLLAVQLKPTSTTRYNFNKKAFSYKSYISQNFNYCEVKSLLPSLVAKASYEANQIAQKTGLSFETALEKFAWSFVVTKLKNQVRFIAFPLLRRKVAQKKCW